MRKLSALGLAFLATTLLIVALPSPALSHGTEPTCTGNTWSVSDNFGVYVYGSGSCTSGSTHNPRYIEVYLQDYIDGKWTNMASGTKTLYDWGYTISKQTSRFCGGHITRTWRVKIIYQFYYSGAYHYGVTHKGQQEHSAC